MWTLTTSIELPIAHCLYRGAYSGLCCGNVYRQKEKGLKEEKYELGKEVFPIIHGHLYKVTVNLKSKRLDKNKMVMDFKQVKEILKEYFSYFDKSTILTPDNPLVSAYLENFKKVGKTNEKLILWDTNPTAEYMASYWTEILSEKFKKFKVILSISVEETSKNLVVFN